MGFLSAVLLCFVIVSMAFAKRMAISDASITAAFGPEDMRTENILAYEGDTIDRLAAKACGGWWGLLCEPSSLRESLQIGITNRLAERVFDSQLHDIILWGNAATGQRNAALLEISQSNLQIRGVFEMTWPVHQDAIEMPFRQFYGASYYYMRFVDSAGHDVVESMAEHKGLAPFMVVVVADNSPAYDVRSDKGYVNVNMFDIKQRLRALLPASSHYLVHASETTAEALDDMLFLFNVNSEPVPSAFSANAARNSIVAEHSGATLAMNDRIERIRANFDLNSAWDGQLRSVTHNGQRPAISVFQATTTTSAATHLAADPAAYSASTGSTSTSTFAAAYDIVASSLYEVVAYMLQDMWGDGSRAPWDRYALIYELVFHPDLGNENDNLLRSMLLSSPDALALISSLPVDTEWIRTKVHSSALGYANTIQNGTWEQWVHCGPVQQYLRSSAVQDSSGYHYQSIFRLHQEMRSGVHVPLVLLAPDINGPYTIVSGSLRALLYYETEQDVEVVLGLSAGAPSWLFWCA